MPENRRPFHRRRSGLDDGIAVERACGENHLVKRRGSNQRAGNDRARDGVGQFRVAADQLDAGLPAGVPQVAEQGCDLRIRTTRRRENGGQQPLRLRADREDVVGIDGHGELASLRVDERDRVAGRHEGVIAPGDDRGVATDSGPLDHRRRIQSAKHREQQLGRQLSCPRFGAHLASLTPSCLSRPGTCSLGLGPLSHPLYIRPPTGTACLPQGNLCSHMIGSISSNRIVQRDPRTSEGR